MAINGTLQPGKVTYQSAHNYSGNDTIVAVVCQTAAPFSLVILLPSILQFVPSCKTDTVIVNIDSKQTKADCFTLDDINTINTITHTNPLHGVITYIPTLV
jgi:hypothetical protein